MGIPHFGIKNAPFTSVIYMWEVFAKRIRKNALIYPENIIIHKNSKTQRNKGLKVVLNIIQDNQLLAKHSKRMLYKRELLFLGQIFSAKGNKADPEKMLAIQQLPLTEYRSKKRAFLGFMACDKRLIP